LGCDSAAEFYRRVEIARRASGLAANLPFWGLFGLDHFDATRQFTTKFQEALADAQSIAAGNDHQYIMPVHLLAAMPAREDGAARSLLQRAGVT